MVFFSLNLSDRRGVSFYRVFFLPSFPALSGATHFSGGNSIDTRVNLSSKCVWYIFFWNFISSSELIFTEFFFYRVFRNRLRLRLKIPFKTGAAFICFVFQLYRVFLFFFFYRVSPRVSLTGFLLIEFRLIPFLYSPDHHSIASSEMNC